MAADPGAFRRQDSIVLAKRGPFEESHPEWRWRSRAPDEWADANLRAVWREAEPIDSVDTDARGGGIARFHRPSGMVLVARWGVLQTVIVADHRR